MQFSSCCFLGIAKRNEFLYQKHLNFYQFLWHIQPGNASNDDYEKISNNTDSKRARREDYVMFEFKIPTSHSTSSFFSFSFLNNFHLI